MLRRFFLNLLTSNWRVITYCVGFCHASAWIARVSLPLEAPSHPRLSQSPGLSPLGHTAASHWLAVLPALVCIPWCSPSSPSYRVQRGVSLGSLHACLPCLNDMADLLKVISFSLNWTFLYISSVLLCIAVFRVWVLSSALFQSPFGVRPLSIQFFYSLLYPANATVTHQSFSLYSQNSTVAQMLLLAPFL